MLAWLRCSVQPWVYWVSLVVAAAAMLAAAASLFAGLLVFVAVSVKLFAVRPAVAAALAAVPSTRFFDALAVAVVVAAAADVSVDAADVSRFGSRSAVAVAVAVAVLARLKLLLLIFVAQQQPFQGDSVLTMKHQHCSIRIVVVVVAAAAASIFAGPGQNTLPLETTWTAIQQRSLLDLPISCRLHQRRHVALLFAIDAAAAVAAAVRLLSKSKFRYCSCCG